ncbi:hypothetical protein Tco_0123072 [Tanacetum coccineum]
MSSLTESICFGGGTAVGGGDADTDDGSDGTDIKEMDKNKGKADKTEHGNGMSARIRVQRLNPLFTIKECSSCGSLYNKGYCCTPNSSQQPLRDCPKCGNPVEGPNCQGCALWRKKLKEVWFTICHENGIYQDLLNTYESSDDDTNVVNAPRELFVVKQDPGVNSSQSPPLIDHHCCYKCGDSLNDIFCQRSTCKSYGKGAHYGYNCPPQIPIISNPEPCYNQNLNEILQNLQSLQQ